MKKLYRYVQAIKTDRGTKFKLRREGDEKAVLVSRQRLNRLADEKRILHRAK